MIGCILQSSYIPWIGFFHLANACERFVVFDSAQYTKRDWRNRNYILMSENLKILSIPVSTKGKFTQQVADVLLAKKDICQQHCEMIRHAYRRSPCFSTVFPIIESWYSEASCCETLTQLNVFFMRKIANVLEIDTEFVLDSACDEYPRDDPTARVVQLCQYFEIDHYLSGPSAQAYINSSLFDAERITCEYFKYNNYSYGEGYEWLDRPPSILHNFFIDGINRTKFQISKDRK